jgi:hypothetical protein
VLALLGREKEIPESGLETLYPLLGRLVAEIERLGPLRGGEPG